MRFIDAVGHALVIAGGMTWEILWSLILGCTLSAIVQALVRRSTVERLLGNNSAKSLAVPTGLGVASFLLLRGRGARSGTLS